MTSSENQIDYLNQQKNESTFTKKLIWIVSLIFIFYCVMAHVKDMVTERAEYKQEAVQSIYSSWASEQTIKTPALQVVNGIKDEKKQLTTLTIKDYYVTIKMKPEIRKKNIFKVPVYTADVTLKGNFNNDSGMLKNQTIRFGFVVSDPKGYIDQPTVKLLNDKIEKVNSNLLSKKIEVLPTVIPFEINYKIRGSKNIKVNIDGENNFVNIDGNWSNPEFTGDFLPKERSINKDGFKSEWTIPRISTNSSVKNNDNIHPQVGINLSMPLDNYELIIKAIKYNFLFLLIILGAFFIFETVCLKDDKAINPIQYGLVGSSIAIFFIFLLSLSEFIPFIGAYTISALISIATIGTYTYFVITGRNIKFASFITGILFMLYCYIYITLVSQGFSLLLGSILLFILIIVLMYITKDYDYYKKRL